jgi:dolichol-phosphate mannosyltransferase
VFFTRLHSPLLEPDEARYAEIPRQMLAAGEFLVPTLHGEPYLHKPPLLYWLVMGGYRMFGVHDWAARLVPAGAAFLTVVVAYFWGRRAVGTRAAFAGALMLCLSARFVYLGRMLTMDSLLGLWVVAAWAAAHRALDGDRLAWRWWLGSAAACGLGLLTKGPVAGVLVVVPVLVFSWLDRRLVWPRAAGWAWYLGLAVAIAGPWYVAAAVQGPGPIADFFWTHNLLRFITPLDHQEPVWFFLPGLVLGMLPWTLLLPALVRWLGRRSGVRAARRPAALGFFLLACAWCLVFFSAAGCKRPGYILPAMPPLALALGCTLAALLPCNLWAAVRSRAAWVGCRLAQRVTVLVLGGAVGVVVVAVGAEMVAPARGSAIAAAGLAALLALWARGPDPRAGVAWVGCGVATLVALLGGLHQVLPGYERKFSLRTQVRPQRARTHDPLVPVVCYPRRWDSVSFYLLRDDVQVFRPERRAELVRRLHGSAETLVFVKSDTADARPLGDLLRDLPPWLEFVPQGSPGIVTAGLVRRRAEAPSAVLARR